MSSSRSKNGSPCSDSGAAGSGGDRGDGRVGALDMVESKNKDDSSMGWAVDVDVALGLGVGGDVGLRLKCGSVSGEAVAMGVVSLGVGWYVCFGS